MTESKYLRRLRGIQQEYDPTGCYTKAQLELETLLKEHRTRTVFLLCAGESEEARLSVVKYFQADGLKAELYDDHHIYYNGDEETKPYVKVTIPDSV